MAKAMIQVLRAKNLRFMTRHSGRPARWRALARGG
ncbi:MAG: hypothetical protein FGM28_08775 [Limnohabitans sp.]|nr:hypothetical protein [Limnohabitans sp.]